MGRRITSPEQGNFNTVRSVELGGTGANNIQEAILNLSGLSIETVGAPNGIAPLDDEVKVPNQFIRSNLTVSPTIEGDTSIFVNQVKTYRITNYDSAVNYSLIPVTGTVTRFHDVITYESPSGMGAGGFILNGYSFSINVLAANISQPSIDSPTEGAASIGENPILTSSPFSTNGSPDTHASSSWQIATDVNFTSIVYQVEKSVTDKTTFVSPSLETLTQYYARVRYHGNDLSQSEWSSPRRFVTKVSFVDLQEEAKLIALDGVAGDYFGQVVACSEDGLTIAIGAPYSDPKGSNSGSVYIFTSNGTSWVQQAKIFPFDGAASDFFGSAVAISADGLLMLAGSIGEDPKASNSGAAYVFRRSGNFWTQVAKIFPDDSVASDMFGGSLTMTPDGSTLVISSYQAETSGYTNNGAVYIYAGADDVWTLQKKLIASNPASNDMFGYRVSISDDGNTLIATSPYAMISGKASQGCAYVFTRTGTVWTQQAILTSSDGIASDNFGQSVSISGDGNVAVVGAPNADPLSKAAAGALYVYRRSNNIWAQEQKLIASDGLSADGFSFSSSISKLGTTIAVGSYRADPSGKSNAGAAYVYTYNGSNWVQNTKLIASDGLASDQFGQSVALNKKGTKLFVGAYWADPKGTDSGALYVFS